MSTVFNTITGDDWKRSIATGRARKNRITEQLRAAIAERPLFIPLKREFFDAFVRGDKWEEFRLYGSRWNERTCRIGRLVTLSLGYGKARRLTGQIVAFRTEPNPLRLPGWFECYGIASAPAACIGIRFAGSARAALVSGTMTDAEKQFLAEIGARGGSVTVRLHDGKTLSVTEAEYARLIELAGKYAVTVRTLLSPSRQ